MSSESSDGAELRAHWVVGFGNIGPNTVELFHGHWIFPVLDWCMADGFRHCFAYAETLEGIQLFEVGADRIAHYGVPRSAWQDVGYATFESYLSSTWKGTLVDWDAALPRVYVPRYMPLTCVSFTKLLIGAQSRALTPYQLYRYLVRNGGKVM